MSNDQKINILSEDRVKLTKDQKNLITLALEKQLPQEDAEFLETVQKDKNKIDDPYMKIDNYFVKKYGSVFGKILFSAITGGENACMETINVIEESNAQTRIKK
ncbi:MAG TPA: hypothetical protein VLF89_10180 [Candidatus Saccharimonadales bacterium]|nr:hypothetical protein [Candidatus Saccharimonadales bacterium]